MEAVAPLIPFLIKSNVKRFCEPCAGDGRLIDHLEAFGLRCNAAYDVEPRRTDIERFDASWICSADLKGSDCIITNPPWDRHALHQIIENCAKLAPTWLLFDADWMHTKQARLHLEICTKIVSIGRVKWFGGTSGMDNCCWYLFDAKDTVGYTQFIGR